MSLEQSVWRVIHVWIPNILMKTMGIRRIRQLLSSNMRKLIITPYNPQWPYLFESFKQRLSKIFGENLTAICHIGSTSVKGLSAKPVIDIMPTVFSLDAVDNLQTQFEKEGFLWRGENRSCSNEGTF